MRITNAMMVNQFLKESNEALGRVSKYQSQVDSTKRLNNIADDPQATLVALKARNRLSNLSLYQTNIEMADSYLTEAESSVSELNEIIQSAYDDVISAQSSKTPDDLKILAENLSNLKSEVLALSNTTLGTSYIFGGYNYTGQTAGTTKKAPFSTSSTGDLIYNGVNLSKLAVKDEFDKTIEAMSSADAMVTDDLEDQILTLADKFATVTADDYAKDLADSALDVLDEYVQNGKDALEAAEELGIATTSSTYSAMKNFIYGYTDTAVTPNVYVKGIADYAQELAAETSKSMAEDGVTYTAAEQANLFSASTAASLMSDLKAMLTATPANSVTRNLQNDIATAWSAQLTAQDAEAGKTTKFQVGTSQTVDVTLTGLDLLGTGSDNIYHLLDKCEKMLNGEDAADKLPQMITLLQNAQSNVLVQQTKIGSTQNRMNLISNRYSSSELNYTEMQSDVEDVDMAEAIMNLSTAQTVYNAALAGGAELIKTSLIDFLG